MPQNSRLKHCPESEHLPLQGKDFCSRTKLRHKPRHKTYHERKTKEYFSLWL